MRCMSRTKRTGTLRVGRSNQAAPGVSLLPRNSTAWSYGKLTHCEIEIILEIRTDWNYARSSIGSKGFSRASR